MHSAWKPHETKILSLNSDILHTYSFGFWADDKATTSSTHLCVNSYTVLFTIVSHIIKTVIELTSFTMTQTIFLHYVFLKNTTKSFILYDAYIYKLYMLHTCINLYVCTSLEYIFKKKSHWLFILIRHLQFSFKVEWTSLKY